MSESNDLMDTEELKENLELITNVLENASEGFVITNAKQTEIIYVNKAYLKITGYTREEAVGNNTTLLKSGYQDVHFYKKMWEIIRKEGFWKGELWDKTKNGNLVAVSLMVLEIKNEKGIVTNYVGILSELTKQKEIEEKVQYLSSHNVLTELPNRYIFIEKINEMIKKIDDQEARKSISVITLDIDKFIHVNDTYGYDVGDELLKEIAYRLKSMLPKEIYLAHFNEDTFGIMGEINGEALETLIFSIRKLFKDPFNIREKEILLTVGLGVNVYPDTEQLGRDVVNNAEKAMLEAKKIGRNKVFYFTEHLNEKLSRRIALENDLRSALTNQEMFIEFQPQVELSSEKVNAAEALIRWEHKEFGLISPGEFIEIAEKTGDIVKIGQWIIEKCCEYLRTHQDKMKDFTIAINISPYQLNHRNFSKHFDDILKTNGISTNNIEIEITESLMMENMERNINKLEELTSKGIKIAVDDFGTGYSSLSYLLKLPISKIKIDKSFINALEESEESKMIVRTIIDMSHNLGYKVIAEGVETLEQLEFLKNHNCDQIQGYYYSKPIKMQKLLNQYLNE
ncbi:PAS domain S-box-containing protein/diguanylate cyclase (GGDEF)-like protein [Natranaerovirga hydrolytica]|uniref:PAS domain S-box-containing protein/diguanylate cyclase (GGDEF)-like protein n=1 Tax=Natranaerovirga hydrolytica TaxID=680378 RepID=A0A4R1MZ23_9FIRM|nr:EAL domain-containing protein [Natranaerovirga hydrolytica]TCK98567.1 PAS domain S-box-containing protein/diguanylate cyclase (GGDEF)-like protein [Natranaerovirga hydrolytica]